MPAGKLVTTQVWPHSEGSWYEVDYGFLKVTPETYTIPFKAQSYRVAWDLPAILHLCEITKQLSESGSWVMENV